MVLLQLAQPAEFFVAPVAGAPDLQRAGIGNAQVEHRLQPGEEAAVAVAEAARARRALAERRHLGRAARRARRSRPRAGRAPGRGCPAGRRGRRGRASVLLRASSNSGFIAPRPAATGSAAPPITPPSREARVPMSPFPAAIRHGTSDGAARPSSGRRRAVASPLDRARCPPASAPDHVKPTGSPSRRAGSASDPLRRRRRHHLPPLRQCRRRRHPGGARRTSPSPPPRGQAGEARESRASAFPARRRAAAAGCARAGRTARPRAAPRGTSAAAAAPELAGRVGLAVAEGRALQMRPEAEAVRRHDQQPAVVLQHPPGLAQQAAGVLGGFQAVDQQDAVEGRSGKGRRSSSATAVRRGARAVSASTAGGSAPGDAARRLRPPDPEKGAGIAEAEHRLAGQAGQKRRSRSAAGARSTSPRGWRRVRPGRGPPAHAGI